MLDQIEEISYILTVTSHVCLTINDDNILMFSYPLPELLLRLLLSLLHTSIHPSIEQQRSEVLPCPIRLLSDDHRSIDPNEQCQDGASNTGCSQAVMGGTE